MRSPTDASFRFWPMRILRPWLVASAAGLLIGSTLLSFSSAPQPEDNSYSESPPRAAVFEPNSQANFAPDPFAPAASLAAPPSEPAPGAANNFDPAPRPTPPASEAGAP